MPETPGPARVQTLKQAKASYKARGAPTLSEREKKQLERAIELERRASRSRELEKKRAEAAKKRAEREKKEREEQARVLLATQRKCDKFGYKSSQMHLGAFLKKPAPPTRLSEPRIVEEDDFGDSDLDDETLLGALDPPKVIRFAVPIAAPIQTIPLPVQTAAVAQPDLPVVPTKAIPSVVPTAEDIYSFMDDFDSGTQIARELSADNTVPVSTQNHGYGKALGRTVSLSFSSDEFDLTVEDMDDLQRPSPATKKVEIDRKLMPPPVLEKAEADRKPMPPPALTKSEADRKLMPPPAMRNVDADRKPMPPPALTQPEMATKLMLPPPLPIKASKLPPPVDNFMQEDLEFLADCDIQLTQLDPG